MKVSLEALDGLPITPRTGKSKCLGEITSMRSDSFMISYEESEKTESPGVFILVYNLEKMNNVWRFFNEQKRQFEIVVL